MTAEKLFNGSPSTVCFIIAMPGLEKRILLIKARADKHNICEGLQRRWEKVSEHKVSDLGPDQIDWYAALRGEMACFVAAGYAAVWAPETAAEGPDIFL